MEFSFDPATGRLYRRDEEYSVFSPWPEPMVVRRDLGGGWRHIHPALSIAPPVDDPALAAYLEPIPRPVIDAIAPFAVAYHWELLAFAGRHGEPASDMLRSNPALGFMIARNAEFRRLPGSAPHDIERQLLARGVRQHEALSWLGFPEAPRVRRIVRRITHDAISPRALRGIRRHIAAPAVRERLAHVPRLTPAVVELVGRGLIDYVSSRLVADVADMPAGDADRLLLRIEDTVFYWPLVFAGEPAPVLHSVARAQQHHVSVCEALLHPDLRRRARPRPGEFSPPPLRGTTTIVPITTVARLDAEGLAQRHCVATYARHIREGAMYVYQVLAPTRATLSIVADDGRWRIGDLRGAANALPPRETLEAVEVWLDRAQR
jgi:hypothetical protein